MRRRDFMAGVVGTAFAVNPPVALSQRSDRIKRVGLLLEYVEGDPEAQARLAAFRDGLRAAGWSEGGNVVVDYRFGGGDRALIPALAAELAALSPDVILGSGAPVTAALQEATRTIPIVFVQASDPVGAGLVPSLGRPGGNVTGFTNFEYTMVGKWLEALKEVAPKVGTVLMIQNPSNFGWPGYLKAMEIAAPSLAVQFTAGGVRDAGEIERTIAAFSSTPNAGMMVLPDTTTSVNRKLIIRLAHQHRLPAVYPFRFFVTDGGLMCYGIDVLDVFRRAASYVDRILRGEKAGDLPIQAPTKFELVINRTTATTLGLTIPTSLLARSDEVID